MFLRKEFWQDSAGPGRQRGGVGQVITFQHVGTRPIIFNLTPDRITTVPPGLGGGRPGRIGEVRIDGELTTLFPPIILQPGSIVELSIAGGGGFGPVEERDLAAILEDIALGLISEHAGRVDYLLDQRVG
jgi:N-methylhydantoinase B